MDTDIKCIRCGKSTNVFTDATYNKDTHTYTLTPICINCKKRELDLNSVISWETKLKNIEGKVADQLIAEKFGNIKFKKSAKKKLVGLMHKYSVRCVFEACMASDSDFNIHLIAQICRDMFKGS